VTLDHFFAAVYRPLRLRSGSPETERLHRAAIRSFSKHLLRDPTLADLDDLALATFLESRASTVSPYTVERERCSLMALARLAFERRLLPVMPVVMPGKLPRRNPSAWAIADFQALLAVARRQTGEIGGVPASDWWVSLVMVAWESGERIGALMAATPRDLRGPHLSIPAEARKGGREGKIHSLSPATVAAVSAVIVPGSDRIWKWPFHRTYLWNRMRKLLQAAGLHGKRLGFNQIRRTAASYVAAAGGDAAEFLGHAAGSGSKVATAWYVDPTLGKKRPAWELLPRVGGEGPDQAG
jgi:integrase